MSRVFRLVVAALIPLVFLGLLAAVAAFAQYPWAFSNPPRTLWESGPAYVPDSSADVTTVTSWVDMLTLTNKTAAAVTVTITDASTNCGAGVCDFMTAVSIAANTTYVVEMRGGRKFPSGIKWSASVASSIIGYMRGVR